VLDSHTRKIAIDSARALGAEICAVDLLDGIRGAVVIELNLSPGLQGITACTDIDVADKIAKYLFKKTKEFMAKRADVGSQSIIDDINISNGDTNKSHEIVTNLDFRGHRILLPDIVTKMTRFDDKDDLVLKIKKGKITIKKLDAS